MKPHARKLARTLGISAVIALSVAGCSNPENRPDPQPADSAADSAADSTADAAATEADSAASATSSDSASASEAESGSASASESTEKAPASPQTSPARNPVPRNSARRNPASRAVNPAPASRVLARNQPRRLTSATVRPLNRPSRTASTALHCRMVLCVNSRKRSRRARTGCGVC